MYSYDKFTKEWHIAGSYSKEYSDVAISVALILWDTYVDEEWGPELRITYFDKEEKNYDHVTAFRVIVDETLFSYEELEFHNTYSYVFGGNVKKQLMNALITGKEVAFQFGHTDTYGVSWTSTIDPVLINMLDELIEMAKLMNASNAWDLDKSPDSTDLSYKATMGI